MLVSKRASAAAGYLMRLATEPPRRGLVVEQRMQGFSNELSGLTVVLQRRIPGFAEPRRGDPGGRLLLGRLGGVPTAVVEGTPRLSAGYLPGECGLAVRALAAMGVRDIVMAATGSALGEGTSPGAMFLALDRLDLTGVGMLRGAGDPELERPIELAIPAPEVRQMAVTAGERSGVAVAAGVAACVHGPLLPTPAERRMMRLLGAEAVTFGLAPELAAAALAGARAVPLVLLDGGWTERHVRFCVALLEAFAPGQPPGLDGTDASA